MPSCAIITCRARSQNAKGTNGRISFHRFPRDPTTKKEWIDVTGRENWMPTKTSTICSKHFQKKDYATKKSGHKYLKCGAIPQEQVVRINFTPTSLASDSSPTTSTQTIRHSNYSGQDKKISDENRPSSSTSTPRKRKLKAIITTKDEVIKRQKKQIKKIQAQNRRLKKKVNKIEDIINDLQNKFNMRNEEMETLRNTNIQVEDLLARYKSKCTSGTDNKQQYSPAIRSFALTLHYYSPKAYEYVRKTFDTCLPHTRTLRKWYSSVEGEPGFTSESFAALKCKVETTKYPIIAALVMDEMAIRRRIEWDGNKLHGYVEIGNNQCSEHITQAKEALVFLVTGINCNFKVPVAYFLVDGVTGDQRSDLVKQCLERIHESGVKIVSLTFDGCASNLAMIKKLGCSFENGSMTFEHPVTKHEVMSVLDPSHMIKLIRNAFQVYQTFVDAKGKNIQWAYLEKLNEVQEKEKFHLRNKLRHRHIHFQNQKMKVKLATQLFSLDVAHAIDFCEKKLNIAEFQDSSATTNFLTIINNLFDIFNTRSLNQYGYKKAINDWNAQAIFAYLDEAVQYISSLKTKDGTLLIKSQRKVGFLGFVGCAHAIKHFYTTLIQTKELLFFPFYKVSQDHLELLFCNIRSHGGANNNPTARQFKAAYKKLLIHVELKDFGNGNCTALENLSILTCSSATKRINLTTDTSNRDFDADNEEDDSEEIKIAEFYQNMSDFSIQVLSHIAGNVVHVLMKKLHCDVCVSALVSNLRNSQHTFIISKDKGGLLYPSDNVITICKKAESVIRHYTDNLQKFSKAFLVTKILQSFVGTTLFDDIAFHQIGEYPTGNHVTDLIKAVIEKYINIRVHFLLKEKVSRETKRQLLNKYVLFQGQ